MLCKRLLAGLVIAASFFFLNIPLLSSYGLNWDEPTHYLRGQAFLRYFMTGKTDYKDLPTIQTHFPRSVYAEEKKANFNDDNVFRRSLYQVDGKKTTTFSYYLGQPTGHPPLNDELASLSNYFFYQKLGISGDIESYRIFTLFASSFLIFLIFMFTAEIWGIFAGLIAVVSFVTYPLFFAESHFNIKDPVSASFYTGTIYALYKAIVTKKIKWIIISSFFAGLALGTRFNIVFVPFAILPWFLVLKIRREFKLPFSFIAKSVLLFLLIPAIILLISWPSLWENPLLSIAKNFNSQIAVGYKEIYQPSQYFILGRINVYPLMWLFFSTPLPMLFFCALGVIYTFKKGFSAKYSISFLILFWFLTPFLRVTVGGFSIYGGLRQIMEFIPAMAILAGIGASYLVQNLKLKMQNYNLKFKIFNFRLQLLTFIFELLIILLFIPITLKLISIHPNQNVYFNSLIGGLKGAKENNLQDWGVNLGSTYQQGIDWLNKNAEQDANLALVRGLHSNVPRIKLRQDINFHNKYFSFEERKGEYIMEIIDYNWDYRVPLKTRSYLETLTPVFSVKVDDVSILKIWKNDTKKKISP